MRTALITLSLMFLGLTAGAQEHDALLMVHFGTTHDATRAKTIDAINDKVSRALPQYSFAEETRGFLEMKPQGCFASWAKNFNWR